jgi:hypothetical protein
MQPTTPEVSCPEEEWFIQGPVPQYLQPAVPKRIVIMQSNTFIVIVRVRDFKARGAWIRGASSSGRICPCLGVQRLL